MIYALLFSFFSAFSLSLFADTLHLRADAPSHYVIKKGDTLWDISALYYRDPWQWPSLWHLNGYIDNPDLIYPGDDLYLEDDKNGQPVLVKHNGVIRLSPQIRELSVSQRKPVQWVDPHAIDLFLSQTRTISKATIKKAPYLIAERDHRVIFGAGDTIYAKKRAHNAFKVNTVFSIYKKMDTLHDPITKEDLGVQAYYVGEATLLRKNKVMTLHITKSVREVMAGEFLLPHTHLDTTFTPKHSSHPIQGQIVSVLNGVSQIGQYQIVTINKGKREQLERGDLLTVHQSGEKVSDPFDSKKMIRLPNEEAGTAMVFRTFDKISYAIILYATTSLHLGDTVSTYNDNKMSEQTVIAGAQ